MKRLRRRAAESGRSVAAEHREILRETLVGKSRAKSLKQYLLTTPDYGRDDDFARKQDGAEGQPLNCLTDTNVISELRKGRRCNPNVARWFAALNDDEMLLEPV